MPIHDSRTVEALMGLFALWLSLKSGTWDDAESPRELRTYLSDFSPWLLLNLGELPEDPEDIEEPVAVSPHSQAAELQRLVLSLTDDADTAIGSGRASPELRDIIKQRLGSLLDAVHTRQTALV